MADVPHCAEPTRDFNTGRAGPSVSFSTDGASTAAALRKLADAFDAERLHPLRAVVVGKARADEFHETTLVLTWTEVRRG